MILPYTEHRVGDGEKKIPLWLDDAPVMAVGLEAWPHAGDRYVIAGELWRVVEITDKGTGERIDMKKGAAVIIPAAVKQYSIRGQGTLYKATVPGGLA